MKKLNVVFYIMLTCCVIYMIRAAIIHVPEMTIQDIPATLNKSPVNRIVSLCKPVPFIILGLDASDRRLAGVNPETKISMQSNVLNAYFPDFQKISGSVCNNAFEPNIEELIRLKPDLILQWKRFTEKIAEMQSFGFHVIGMEYDGSEGKDRDMVRILAAAIDRKAKADSIMRWRDSSFLKLRDVTDTIPLEKRPKVIFLYNYENFRVGGEKCYENFCIELAGGRNMGKGLGTERSVNIEQILVWNPDIILIGGWRTKITPQDLYQNPILKEVSAVKNLRVFKMPVWSSNESVLTWKWMAEIFHPGDFDYNIREEIRLSSTWQYHINLTEADIDQVLFYSENAISPLYTRFKQLKEL